jgi:hypothetical protein
VLDGVDEEDSPGDDETEGDQDLQVDDAQSRHVGIGAMGPYVHPAESEWGEIVRGIADFRLEVPADIPGVDPDQHGGRDPADPGRVLRQERGTDGDRVGDREIADVVAEDTGIDAHLATGGAPAPECQHRHAGDEHRERGEHERRSEDGPHADLVRRRARREDDRDDRDQRLGQGGPDRGQDRTHGSLGQIQRAPEPFDPVGEQLGPDEDDDERDEQDEQIQGSGSPSSLRFRGCRSVR